jgi:hypothetical protein
MREAGMRHLIIAHVIRLQQSVTIRLQQGAARALHPPHLVRWYQGMPRELLRIMLSR